MGDSCRGLWMEIVVLVGKRLGGWVRMFDRHEEDEKEKEGSGRAKEDDWGRLTLKAPPVVI